MTYLRNAGKRLWVPSPFFVILGGPEPVLVDTSGSGNTMSGMRAEPVENILEFEDALVQVGLKREEIGIVVHTHLMYDHCANSKRLPKARFIVQKKELEFAFDPHPMLAGAYQQELFEGLNFDVVEGDRELMPGIRLLLTPGHTPGTQSVAVETASGLAVITGFCCVNENFQPKEPGDWKTDRPAEVIPPGIHTDMVQGYESMLRIREMADIIIPFHDPSLEGKERIPEG
jgi:glyoxylase-like metal-dependent hydrolase (beta-lactamase superfamily II)